eukprot:UN03851
MYVNVENEDTILWAEHVTSPFNVLYTVEKQLPKRLRIDPTKSGKFRCDLCNLNLTSEVTLKSHLNGKSTFKTSSRI